MRKQPWQETLQEKSVLAIHLDIEHLAIVIAQNLNTHSHCTFHIEDSVYGALGLAIARNVTCKIDILLPKKITSQIALDQKAILNKPLYQSKDTFHILCGHFENTSPSISLEYSDGDEILALHAYQEDQWLSNKPIHLIDPKEGTSSIKWIDEKDIKFAQTNNNAHKGTYKKALMIGGSLAMPGAITLAAKACYRSGIGTLTLGIPDCIYNAICKDTHFAMKYVFDSKDGHIEYSSDLENTINKYGLISCGNGMGITNQTEKIVEALVQSDKPLVLDADAITIISKHKEWLQRNAPTILTPHLGEFSRLVDFNQGNLFELARNFSKNYPNTYTIIKSSFTTIAHDGDLSLFSHPNRALAKGGSGDVLCGMVTGLLGQLDIIDACKLAVVLHNHCADDQISDISLCPEDLIEAIPRTYAKLKQQVSVL